MASSSVVVSGDQSPKRKRKAKRKSSRRPRRPSSLPQSSLTILPVEAESQSEPQSEPEKKGLFDSLKESLLGKPEPKAEAASPSESPSSTESTTGSSAAPEVERKLAAVPDVVGDPGELAGGEVGIGPDDVTALMDAIAFEEQDVKDTLSELFDWLAEHFESEHWKLSDRQVRMLGRPTAQLLNSLWSKLKLRIPDILARWCESTPGATAFLMAFGLVVVPKGLKQLKLSKEKARKALPGQPATPTATPGAKRPTGASVQADAVGIPMQRGIVGGQ